VKEENVAVVAREWIVEESNISMQVRIVARFYLKTMAQKCNAFPFLNITFDPTSITIDSI